LPIIVESAQGEIGEGQNDGKVDPNDPNEILKSRKIKSNTKIEFQSYEERRLTTQDGDNRSKKARVIDKRVFDTESSKA